MTAEDRLSGFNDGQLAAITVPERTLIVSAGAGSGKTTVLTQRILESIIKGVDISQILVVTFLRSAAASLRSKLYSLLLEYVNENPGKTGVARNLYLIPSARISTVDSFCLDIVRENFSALSIPPGVRVIDTCENAILLDTCLEKFIERKLAENDKRTLLLCDNFADYRSLRGFKDAVCAVLAKYRALPFWRERVAAASRRALDSAAAAEKGGFFACECGAEARALTVERMRSALKCAYSLHVSCDTYFSKESDFRKIDYTVEFLEEFVAVAEDGGSYADIASYLKSWAPPRNAIIKDEEFKELFNGEFKQIETAVKKSAALFSGTEEEAIEGHCRMAKIVEAFNGFVLEFEREYYESKKTRSALDFADFEQLALELLGSENADGTLYRTEFCETLRAGIKEIYVDEYQDINPLQDMIFRLISKENNRFMVGDVKQSIYRFRNSSVKIFMEYLKNFADLDEKASTGRVFLNENFRSRGPVLDFVNLLFEKLYTEQTAGFSYENEKLRFPKKKEPCVSAPVEVDLFTGENARVETEAEFVAAEIRSLVESGAYKYGDIAVIMRSTSSNGIVFRKAFDAAGIPYASDKKEDFLSFPEIQLALAVLRAVDDPLDDISLAASLRSPVFRFTAEDLYEIKRYYAYDSLYECLRHAAASYLRRSGKGHIYKANRKVKEVRRRPGAFLSHSQRQGERPGDETCKKCADALSMLLSLKRSGAECSGSRLIWLMYQKTGLVSLCSCEKGGEKRVSHLNSLYKFALDYEKTSFRGLSEFLRYLEISAGEGNFNPESEDDEKELVKILTIHQSKGLEYPVVFVSDTGKKFNDSDQNAGYLVSEHGDLTCCLVDGFVKKSPAAHELQKEKEKRSSRIDELFCLYVALTRAMERLYVTGVLENPKAKEFFACSRAAEWIYGVIGNINHPCFVLNENPAPKTFTAEKASAEEETVPESVFRRALEFEYPEPMSSKVPAKAAVSELRKGILEDDEYTRSISASECEKVPSFASVRDDAASIGTSTHLFMQFASFENVLANGVENETERLVSAGMIAAADAARVDKRALGVFFASPLCREIMESPRVMREKRFNIIEDSALLSGVAGENVMIQGVIDCFFQNPDGTYTVVDYKTDRVKREDGEETLKARHSMQILYYCRAIERMTGGKVSRAVLWSFSLGRAVEVPYEG
ncbi:MAG: UvrD-helicase domain-containing protein [Clostridia bacterium]|nr:UvrD-helicase domain-containing protein [Clostridia bacterium]